jgi:hypothetical protein
MKLLKRNLFNTAAAASAGLLLFSSCHKEARAPAMGMIGTGMTGVAAAGPKSIYVLNAGTLNPLAAGNTVNSTLTYYNDSSQALVPDIFSQVNGFSLGAGAADMGMYGAKIYITLAVSNVIDVINAQTAKLIRQINLPAMGNAAGRFPADITFYQGEALVTCLDGTVAVFDTASLINTKNIQLAQTHNGASPDPEGLVVAGNKLYVAEPGSEGTGNTVCVIDLATLTEIKQLMVIPYPQQMAADAQGNVYVLSNSNGDFGSCTLAPGTPQEVCSDLGGMTIIDSHADTIKAFRVGVPPVTPGTAMTAQGDSVYFANSVPTGGGGGGMGIAIYNGQTQMLANPDFIGLSISPHTITVSPVTREVFIDACMIGATAGGMLYAYDKTGKLEYTKATGVNPVKVVVN